MSALWTAMVRGAVALTLITTTTAWGQPTPTNDRADAILRDLADLVEGVGTKGNRLPRAVDDASYHPRSPEKEQLGRLLFFDKILSGNRNISCATCHHPLAGTSDGLSLPVGEGGRGISITRNTGSASDAIHERVPRNAPAIYNLGAREFEVMFHDGRVVRNPLHPSGFDSPAGLDLPIGLDHALAAQAMFPVTSPTEMAGQPTDGPMNEIAGPAAIGDLAGPDGVWARLALRLRAIPEYVDLFVQAFDGVHTAADIDFVHAANAIAAYEAAAFRADDSPFDRYLRGDRRALSDSARQGMTMFYGKAGCSSCHSGPFQTDHSFAAIAMPQIGPGKGHNLPGFTDGRDDLGREAVTGDPRDRLRFRVPTLRNVALTGPWGHDGAYGSLEAVVRHHLDPIGSLHGYESSQALLPPRPDLDAIDMRCHENATRRGAIARANELRPASLNDEQLAHVMDFLHALTDPRSLDQRSEVPMRVPSKLPVFE